MKIRKSIITLIASVFVLSAPAQSLEGYWKGAVEVQGVSLDLCFDVKADGDGYKATMDVPQQGAMDIPVKEFSTDGFNVKIDIAAIQATFDGIIALGNISGTFHQNGLDMKLLLERSEKAEMKRPQTPKPPFPYSSEEVKFTNKAEGITLAGTLTVPAGDGPFPAVVMITGSGSQDRNEEFWGHQLFYVIADCLSRNGVAVLRFDDRGVGESEPGKTEGTTADLAYDAEAAVDFMRARGGFTKIGVLGHSEGGCISFILGAREKVDFIVSLAGPSLSGTEVIATQQRAIYEAMGVPEEQISANEQLFADLFKIILKADAPKDAEEEMDKRLTIAGTSEETKQQVLQELLLPWMFHFLKYDPAEDIKATRCPVLALNGSKDVQVVAVPNMARYVKLGVEAPELEITMRTFADLNHMFQHCDTGVPAEYPLIEETISPEVLEVILDFISNKI